MSVKAMTGMYEALLVPVVTYDSETWVRSTCDRSCVEAVKFRYLRSVCQITKYDRMQRESNSRVNSKKDETGRKCVNSSS